MSNFDWETVVRVNGDSRVRVGPEIINGTGEVWLATSMDGVLTNDQARHVGAMLIQAADYAAAVQRETAHPVGWPPGTEPTADWPPGSVHAYEWTDPAWRTAARPSTPPEGSDGP